MKNNIKKIRLDLHHTQEDVARNTNIHQSTISKIERGVQDPSCEQIQILSQFFNTSTDYLYGLQEEPSATTSFHEERFYINSDQNWREKAHLWLMQEMKSPEVQKEIQDMIHNLTRLDS